MSALSVVIPAHDEETLLPALLRGIVADPEIEVVVVANGCTDATAAAARSVSPRIVVVEIEEASKVAALNRGDEVATAWPRAYVDADVEVDAHALRVLAAELRAGPALVGSPRLVIDLSGASRAVRMYYRIWELTDYRMAGHIGSGVYAVSETGRRRFGRFPDLIADDLYVQTRFAPSERVTTLDAGFTVRAPRTWRALLHRSERIALGNLQLAASGNGAATGSGTGARALIARVWRRPALWPAFLVYVVGYVVPRLRARRRWRAGRVEGWNRDLTTRVAA